MNGTSTPETRHETRNKVSIKTNHLFLYFSQRSRAVWLGGAGGVRIAKVAETMRVSLAGQNKGGMLGDGGVGEVS